ncbi:ceramidase domain-containing protein [Aestuariivita boseongensis]|uniref:ceramidase domain-containing protein n=1 Tax=Aestuariivita boseongensis TaxID=1470562 RepID=UPI00067FDB39|nr:ceramidase domain-containing protein [Aestuariivita boseongensis]
MELTRAIDGYCERLDPGYWAEPVNAVTNAAFLIAAFVMLRRSAGVALAQVLVVILFAIGVGSYLFHTHAQVWAALLDVVPILLFILVDIFAINRDVWGFGTWGALGLTAMFFPYAAATVPVFQLLPIGGTAGYAPVPLLILIYAFLLRGREPALARGFVIGAGILILSMTMRTIDEPLCDLIPMGTHYWWHLLNAMMLGWMIEVYLRYLRHQA